MIESDEPLDLVVFWVDGEDPKWGQKYRQYVKQPFNAKRHKQHGELELCLASASYYMPWLRNIFLITDAQTPSYAKDYKKLKIIDHQEILGEKCATPNFNSNAIQTYIHKIPGLSETFLIADDDTIVGRPTLKNYFFEDKTPAVDFASLKASGGWMNSVQNSRLLIEKLFHHMPEISDVILPHWITVLTKSSVEKTWELLQEELLWMGTHRVRKYDEPGYFSFYLVSMLIGVEFGFLKARYVGSYSDLRHTQYFSHNKLSMGKWLANIQKDPPRFYAVNDFDNSRWGVESFQKFKNRMMRKFKNG